MTARDEAVSPSITTFLGAPLTVGAPDSHGALTVFPIFGAGATQRFVSFAQGRESGAVTIKEVVPTTVRDLRVANAGDVPVLLYEGEEVLGGQQNRSFDDSLLVAPGVVLTVPVSCVEAGRWDHSRHGAAYSASPQSSYPEMRRRKYEEKERRRAAGLAATPDQGQVWSLIDAKSSMLAAVSHTGAMSDIYEQRRADLRQFAEAVRLRDGQLGTLAAIGGRFCVLDLVARADVFASLHAPLVQGYALDALEAGGRDDLPGGREDLPGGIAAARGFVSLVCGAPTAEHDTTGLGRAVTFAEGGIAGTALVNEGELVQMTAFPRGVEGAGEAAAAGGGRVRRPSRRRPHQ
jgi:hypothetical protein